MHDSIYYTVDFEEINQTPIDSVKLSVPGNQAKIKFEGVNTTSSFTVRLSDDAGTLVLNTYPSSGGVGFIAPNLVGLINNETPYFAEVDPNNPKALIVTDTVYNSDRTRNLYFTYTADAGVEVEMLPAPEHADRYFAQHNYGFVQYELTNHLGNVHTTISNRFGFKRELYPPVTVPEIGIGDWFASQVTAEGDGGGALLVSGGPGEVGFHLDQNNTAPQTLWFDIAGATTPLTVQCRDFYTDSLIAEVTANNGSNVMLFRTPNPGAVTFSWNTPASQSFGISNVYMSTDIRSADIRSVNDYYSFGSLKPGRLINADGYSRGFNGMYKDDEIKGSGNSLNFGARIYDSRLGRWLSMDPLASKQPGWSSYKAFLDNPIIYIDPEGETEYLTFEVYDETTGETETFTIVLSDEIFPGSDVHMKDMELLHLHGHKVKANFK